MATKDWKVDQFALDNGNKDHWERKKDGATLSVSEIYGGTTKEFEVHAYNFEEGLEGDQTDYFQKRFKTRTKALKAARAYMRKN